LYQLFNRFSRCAILDDRKLEGEAITRLDIDESNGHLWFIKVEPLSELSCPIRYFEQKLVLVQILIMMVGKFLALNQFKEQELTFCL
jgi:hypothetical protein